MSINQKVTAIINLCDELEQNEAERIQSNSKTIYKLLDKFIEQVETTYIDDTPELMGDVYVQLLAWQNEMKKLHDLVAIREEKLQDGKDYEAHINNMTSTARYV